MFRAFQVRVRPTELRARLALVPTDEVAVKTGSPFDEPSVPEVSKLPTPIALVKATSRSLLRETQRGSMVDFGFFQRLNRFPENGRAA